MSNLFVKNHAFVKSFWTDLPSWQDFLNHLEFCLKNNEQYSVKNLLNGGFVTHDGRMIPQVDELSKHIATLKPDENTYSAHIYMSIHSFSGVFDNHKDISDVFLVQAQGNMCYEVTEGDVVYTHLLTPGDLLYVPKDMYHKPVPVTPRVTLSIGFP